MNNTNPTMGAGRKSVGRVHLTTLGCKVNQYETQFVKELLEHNGWMEASQASDADLCIVNTCTVTHEGDAKSRQAIRRLHQDNPTASILVMGCYATRDPEAVASLPGVSQVVTDKNRLEEELSPLGVTGSIMGISRFDDHQRAFVKVQDGCLLNCSYCIIPSIRPVVRSRPISEIVEEVNRLADSGYQEMVLTGIHLGHYGIDLSKGKPKAQWSRLWHLLENLSRLPDRFRLRLSSLEAAEARDDLIRVMADQPRICSHLHLCLQSGSDRILAAMKRRYRQHGFLERIARIRQVLDEPAITTDVIVGFPGESEADFAETCKVVREAEISRIHVFSYSPREGTEAAQLRDDVPASVKAARRRVLEELGREMAERYQRRLIGRELEVLVEGVDPKRPGYARGTSCRFVPMSFPGQGDSLKRQRVRVRALRVEDAP
ncbi:MAG: tRNA (N(6)-L-threonylcarbamoyladenosine(37)-C(2))-methylthiotransferase MtaB [Gemmataceae bacterium]